MDDGSTVKLGPVMVQSELLTILSHSGRVTFLFSLVLAFAIVADRGCGSAAILKPQRVVSSNITVPMGYSDTIGNCEKFSCEQ